MSISFLKNKKNAFFIVLAIASSKSAPYIKKQKDF